ncbi:beta/gamma-crystallin-like [Amphiura filiformis]|uniref:beta/gamma-crystallin-like n=1 Tax=Amphiura filiformis TaxID=82378 RepID=UPI003B20D05C
MAWVTLILGALVMVSGLAKAAEIPIQGLSDHTDLLAKLDGNPNEDAIKEWLMKPAASPEIVLFEHDHYQGGYQIHYKSHDNLHNIGFGDRLSSCVVKGGTWVFFKDSEYRDRQFVVEVGDYPTPSYWSGTKDEVSSLKLLACTG